MPEIYSHLAKDNYKCSRKEMLRIHYYHYCYTYNIIGLIDV